MSMPSLNQKHSCEMMYQPSTRCQKNKSSKIKTILQLALLLGVVGWLLYQVKHSYDRRNEYFEDKEDESMDKKEVNYLGRKASVGYVQGDNLDKHEDLMDVSSNAEDDGGFHGELAKDDEEKDAENVSGTQSSESFDEGAVDMGNQEFELGEDGNEGRDVEPRATDAGEDTDHLESSDDDLQLLSLPVDSGSGEENEHLKEDDNHANAGWTDNENTSASRSEDEKDAPENGLTDPADGAEENPHAEEIFDSSKVEEVVTTEVPVQEEGDEATFDINKSEGKSNGSADNQIAGHNEDSHEARDEQWQYSSKENTEPDVTNPGDGARKSENEGVVSSEQMDQDIQDAVSLGGDEKRETSEIHPEDPSKKDFFDNPPEELFKTIDSGANTEVVPGTAGYTFSNAEGADVQIRDFSADNGQTGHAEGGSNLEQ